MKKREFPGDSVKLNSRLSLPGTQVQSLVRELRSHKPQNAGKKKRAKEMRNSGAKTSLIKVKNSLELFKRKFIQKEEIICQAEDRIMLNIESNKQTKRKD